MKRYDVHTHVDYDVPNYYLEECETGEVVKAEDALARIAELQAALDHSMSLAVPEWKPIETAPPNKPCNPRGR